MSETLTKTNAKAGTGYSQNENSFEAGVEIANKAVKDVKLSSETLFFCHTAS